MTVLTKRLRNDFPLGFSPFESLFNDLSTVPETFTPNYEVVKGEDTYRVFLEVPGVKKEDIHLNLERGMLSISGEKKRVEENTETSTRLYSSFKESFRLPEDIDEENVTAKLEEGILEITLNRIVKKEKTNRDYLR